MPRIKNWPRALSSFIESRRTQPFDWAGNNCCFFACDWIAALTAIDPAADLRPQVASAADAVRVLTEQGGVEQIAASRCQQYGWPEVAPAFAQRGDIAMVSTDHGPALGVVIGAKIAHPGPEGLTFLPLTAALRAWHVQ